MYSISCYKEPLNFENTLHIRINRVLYNLFFEVNLKFWSDSLL
jgi:hypothetical protein